MLLKVLKEDVLSPSTHQFSGLIATEYELFMKAIPHYADLHRLLIVAAIEHPNSASDHRQTVLDIGTGTGYGTRLLLEASSRFDVITVDNESAMLNHAKHFLSEPSNIHSRIKFIHDDALRYLSGMEPGSIDLVVSGWTLHNWTRDYRVAAVKQIHRVLAPQGIFLNADKYADDIPDRHIRNLHWQIKNFFSTYLPIGRTDILEEWVLHYLLDEMPDRKIQLAEEKELLQEIGFTKVRVLKQVRLEALVVAAK